MNLRPSILLLAAAFLAFGQQTWAESPLPAPPPGWKIETVAEAPEIKHPSVVCSAPDGRIFVAEDPMDISAPAHASHGRIVCFHPDGRRTTFAENLYAIFGMQYLDGKLYVLHNPKFSVFADQGDHAGAREDLIESTNPNPWALEWNDHVPANFQLGMDGYFYVSVGDKGIYGAVGRDGKRLDLHGGGIIRLRPDGSELEIFSTGTRNTLDVAMNEEDEIFTYDNTDEQHWMGRLTHMVDGGFYGYPYDFIPQRPYTLWMMADYGAGAATGTFAYIEDALPEEYRGNLFLADFGKKQIIRVKIERKNGTYDDVDHREIFTEVPPLFRPVGICPSADGLSIYICDWQHLDNKENVTVGRLVKMTYAGPSQSARKPGWFVAAAQGKAFMATAGELIAALSHPSRSVRMVAQRRLAERKEIGALLKILRDPKTPARAKWHAIWACDAIDKGKQARLEILDLSLTAEPSVRRQAIRQLGTRRAIQARSSLEKSLEDPDASIRFYAATALGRLGSSASVSALREGLSRERYPFPRYALFHAIRRIGLQNSSAWPEIVRGLLSGDIEVEQGIFHSLREVYDLKLARQLNRIAINGANPTSSRVLALRLLGLIHKRTPEWKGEWWAYHPVNQPPPEKSVPWEGTSLIEETFQKVLSDPVSDVKLLSLQTVREMKAASLAPEVRKAYHSNTREDIKRSALETLGALVDTNAVPIIAEQLRGTNLDLTIAALQVAKKIPSSAYSDGVSSILQDTSANPQAVVLAIDLAEKLEFPALAGSIEDLVDHESDNVRMAAFRALTKIEPDKALHHLEQQITSEEVQVRRIAVEALGKFPGEQKIPLLRKALKDEELRADALRSLSETSSLELLDIYLQALAEPDPFLREKARKALQPLKKKAWRRLEQQLPNLPPVVIAELQQVYASENELLDKLQSLGRALGPDDFLAHIESHPGDAAKGRLLLHDLNGLACIKCHKVGNAGTQLGPDLTTIGAQFSRRELAEHILFPSKSVREGYENYQVEMKDGESYSGLFKGETADEIRLLDSSGTLQRIPRSEVKGRKKSDLSLMPEGLHTALELDDFVNLVAYLESLKSSN